MIQVQTTSSLPVINIFEFVNDPTSHAAIDECYRLADAIKTFGAFAIKDPRVSEQENNEFLDLIEDYFSQTTVEKMKDTRPDLHYQVGATPANTELPRCGRDSDCLEMVEKMDPENRPFDFTKADPKWRYFWRMGQPPLETKFKQLNDSPVIPQKFPSFAKQMNSWGSKLLDAVSVVSEMLAVGLDLPRDTFTKLAENGPHLLAPTASDLSIYGQLNTVLAGFHADLNFLTIHGKSRFAGLYVWTREGQKLLVKIPDGCLLVQAAKQLEYITGGYIVAGYHEVVVVEETLKAMERQKERHRPLWRISSTLFYHLASDHVLEPIEKFKNEETAEKYSPIYVGEQVQRELGFLELAKK